MTRHYTHIGIEAARGAVAALPTITTEVKKTNPKAAPSPAEILATIRNIAGNMTEKNWKNQAEAILKAASSVRLPTN